GPLLRVEAVEERMRHSCGHVFQPRWYHRQRDRPQPLTTRPNITVAIHFDLVKCTGLDTIITSFAILWLGSLVTRWGVAHGVARPIHPAQDLLPGRHTADHDAQPVRVRGLHVHLQLAEPGQGTEPY